MTKDIHDYNEDSNSNNYEEYKEVSKSLSDYHYYSRYSDLLMGISVNIWEKSGHEVITNNELKKHNIDLETIYNQQKYYVEVISTTFDTFKNLDLLRRDIREIYDYSRKNNAIPVLFVYAVITDEYRNRVKKEFDNLIIFDLSNILYSVQSTNVQNDLVEALPFSVEQIEHIENDKLNLSWFEHSNNEDDYLMELDNCLVGVNHSRDFEIICFKMLKYIFRDDLSLWNEQYTSNKKLYRFDLICRIKDNNTKSIWYMMEKFFNSKYVIFEFKNYSKFITQNEIFTTEKYLYGKALRNVAIIIARKGYNENSLFAARGCLRETGKLIIPLTVDDLKTMYLLRKSQKDPSSVLLDKVDELLIKLEK